MGKQLNNFLEELNRKRWSVAGGGVYIKTQELQFALETLESCSDKWLTTEEQSSLFVWSRAVGLIQISSKNKESETNKTTLETNSQQETEFSKEADRLDEIQLSILDGVRALGIKPTERVRSHIENVPLLASEPDLTNYQFGATGSSLRGTVLTDTEDLTKAIAYLEKVKNKSSGVVIFYDVDAVLPEERTHPSWSALLSFLQNNWDKKNNRVTSVFIGVKAEILPDVIKPYVSVMHFPLPDYEELEEILDDRIYNTTHLTEFYGSDYVFDEDLKRKMINSALGLTRIEFATAVQEAKQTDNSLTLNDISLINQIRSEKYADVALERYGFDFNMGDVGGLEELKNWLEKRKILWELDPKETKIPRPKGLLLTGLPGTGKSLTAKVVASHFGMPLMRFDIGSVFGQYYGQSEAGMRNALKAAENSAPCILWIDEIEKAFGNSQSSGEGQTFERVKATFLTWLQEHRSDIFTIATANDVAKLPMEMMRKGRFDEVFFLDLPNDAERKAILTIHLKKKLPELLQEVNFDNLSTAARGFVGAEIEQVIVSAMIDALSEKTKVTEEILIKAFFDTQPLSRTQRNNVIQLRRWAQEANAVRASKGDSEELNGPNDPF